MGPLLLAADEQGLTGLWFEGQKHWPDKLFADSIEGEMPIFDETRRWLDIYFSGQEPDFWPPLAPQGTAFQQSVWRLLTAIPYGHTTTYAALAKTLAAQMGRESMSAQAVGQAVGRNPISVLIPCHRVIGSNGRLTGYAGGLERKLALLRLEGLDAGPLRLS